MINNNYLTDRIMGQSRHQFVYGYNGKEREEFLKGVTTSYPIILDSNNPIGIYICDKGLPEFPKTTDGFDEFKVQVLNRSYIEYLITYNVLNTTIEQIDEKTLNDRSEVLLRKVNNFFLTKDRAKLTSLVDFKKMIEETKQLYYDNYIKYISRGDLNNFDNKVPIRMVMMEYFIEYYKKMINTTSHLGIIFDQQELLSNETQKAINNYVGSRINGTMSMKIACQPEEWKTYYNQNGILVQYDHDYEYIELDSCQSEYMKKQKKNRQIGNE